MDQEVNQNFEIMGRISMTENKTYVSSTDFCHVNNDCVQNIGETPCHFIGVEGNKTFISSFNEFLQKDIMAHRKHLYENEASLEDSSKVFESKMEVARDSTVCKDNNEVLMDNSLTMPQKDRVLTEVAGKLFVCTEVDELDDDTNEDTVHIHETADRCVVSITEDTDNEQYTLDETDTNGFTYILEKCDELEVKEDIVNISCNMENTVEDEDEDSFEESKLQIDEAAEDSFEESRLQIDEAAIDNDEMNSTKNM